MPLFRIGVLWEMFGNLEIRQKNIDLSGKNDEFEDLHIPDIPAQ